LAVVAEAVTETLAVIFGVQVRTATQAALVVITQLVVAVARLRETLALPIVKLVEMVVLVAVAAVGSLLVEVVVLALAVKATTVAQVLRVAQVAVAVVLVLLAVTLVVRRAVTADQV
jgi:hypothetical protein